MTIAAGQKLPDVSFKTPTADGPAELTTADVFAGKKVVLFGVPGAFTPTCHANHLPGFLTNHDAFLAKGADTIAVGLGLRTKRFSMIVDDGTVAALNIEDNPGQAESSAAEALLEQM